MASDDEAGAICHLLNAKVVSGPVNLVAPTPVTNREFTAAIGRELHRPTILPTPLLTLKARYGNELVQSLLVSGQRVDCGKLRASGYEFVHPELDGALRAVLKG